ncbi:hypothetical protein ACS0TY_032979 [Phlomoides rotata]
MVILTPNSFISQHLQGRRLWNKLQGWRNKKVSKAWTKVLIKSAAQAVPAFCMASFLLPPSLEDRMRILKIIHGPSNMTDRQIWHFEKNGSYYVRSAYKLAAQLTFNNTQDQIIVWNKMWGFKIPPKIKSWLWRCCNNFLTSKDRLCSKGMNINLICDGCSVDRETSWHVFMQAIEVFDDEDAIYFAMVGYRIWHERNNMCWERNYSSLARVLSEARSLLHEWRATRVMIGSTRSIAAPCGSWHLPATGRVKLNIDAAQFHDVMATGLGMVIRDDLSSFLVAKIVCFPGTLRADEDEAIGLYKALSWIKNLAMDNIEVEMDAKVVVDALHSGLQDGSVFGCYVRSCMHL